MKNKLVLFNGLSYFGKKLVNDLQVFDPPNKFKFIDTYTSKLQQLAFLFNLRKANVVVSFNGVTTQSGSLDRAISRNIPLIMYWHGTDVLLAQQRFNSKTFVKKYSEVAHHFTDADWLQKELEELGINAQILPFKYVEGKRDVGKYEKVSVLTYLAEGKEAFYGLNDILKLAFRFPEVVFTIVGSNGRGIDHTSNVIFKGWCMEMDKLRKENAIFIRLTEHDGNALSVLEALSYGQEVIWNYPGEKCHFVHDYVSTEKKLSELILKIEKRGMIASSENIEYVNLNYSKEKILNNFKNTILHFAK